MQKVPFPTIFKRLQSTMTPPKTYVQRPSPPKPLAPPILLSQLPDNFVLAGIHTHIKKKSVPDLGMILSTVKGGKGASAAACFTKNAFKAAPVLVSEEVLRKNGGRARGVIVNSGCANAVTGKQGMEDAWSMVRETDKVLKEIVGKDNEGEETLVMSTGVIGQNLPIQNIITGIRSLSPTSNSSQLGSTEEHWDLASRAFLTTDTFPKLRARTFRMGGVEYRMAGMDKGAGMIHPDMGPPSSAALHATLLGCILTDAPISPRSAQSALTYAVERSFNSISVDGDMSTNDTIILLANGAGAGKGVAEVDEDTHPREYEEFKTTLTEFAIELAQLVVRDGEGATKFVTVTVKGAPTYEDAHKVASRISTSALVKTALYGEDANWGRVLAATGSLPLSRPLSPTSVSVSFVPSDNSPALPVLVNGEPEKVDEVRAKEILEKEEFEVLVELGMGSEEARYWTCDFSYEYVSINGDYRT